MIKKLKNYVKELELDYKEIKEKMYDDDIGDYYDRVAYWLSDFVDSPIEDYNVDLICYHEKSEYDYVFVLVIDNFDKFSDRGKEALLNRFHNVIDNYYYGDDNVQVYVVCQKYLGFGFDLPDYSDFDIYESLDYINTAVSDFYEDFKADQSGSKKR